MEHATKNIIPGIGKRVANRLTELGWTQEQFSDSVREFLPRIDRPLINKFINQKKAVTIDTLMIMAKVLNVNISYLLSDNNDNVITVDKESPSYKAYVILQTLDESLQHHYHFVFNSIQEEERRPKTKYATTLRLG